MNKTDILGIPLNTPGTLFPDPTQIKEKFRKLAQIWHPDKPSGDTDVFSHINKLHYLAIAKMEEGLWDTGTMFTGTSIKGAKFKLPYKFKKDFELGTYYVNSTKVLYLIDKKHKKLYDNAIQCMKPVFPSDRVKKEISRFLPILRGTVELKNHYTLILETTPDVVPLRWVLEKFKKVDPKQAAWMTSSILNICCGLQTAHMVHNDISVDSIFISIKHHSGLLLGGWWYSGKQSSRMINVPERTYNMMPNKIRSGKGHEIQMSLITCKATIMEMLGNASGPKLRLDKDIPKPFIDWLLSPSTMSPIKAYQQWKNEVLPLMKYKKEFVTWEIPEKELLT